MTKTTERTIQVLLAQEAMIENKHDMVVPNSRLFWYCEADFLSVTKAGLIHEYEIKLSISDYKADFKKKRKHRELSTRKITTYQGAPAIPSYFWYVTYDFDIEPPEYAGWMKVIPDMVRRWDFGADEEYYERYRLDIKKVAPRLHRKKVTDKQRRTMARSLSFRYFTYNHGLIILDE